MNGTIGEIRLFGGNFAPRTWAFCSGQLLAIASNTALFSIIGCTYGGDCRTSMALPDLRSRTAIGAGNGPGLPNYNLGQRTGQESVVLVSTQMPSHSHALLCNASGQDENSPQGHFFAVGETIGNPPNFSPVNTIYSTTANSQANSLAIANSGATQSHNNMQPSLGLNYIICLTGIFPSRS